MMKMDNFIYSKIINILDKEKRIDVSELIKNVTKYYCDRQDILKNEDVYKLVRYIVNKVINNMMENNILKRKDNYLFVIDNKECVKNNKILIK